MVIKYRLKDFKMSDHAEENQGIRKMSSYEITKILNLGERTTQPDGRIRFKLGLQFVIVDFRTMTIITVYPGDRAHTTPKIQIPEEIYNNVLPLSPRASSNKNPMEEIGKVIPLKETEDEGYEDIDLLEYISGDYFKKTG